MASFEIRKDGININLIACHGGPAKHFINFAKHLTSIGHNVQIYASGPALKVFQESELPSVNAFSLEDGNQERVAKEIAQKCNQASLVITDVGHTFSIVMQQALAHFSPKTKRIAYYDNPEVYVPGGYSQVASEVMNLAQQVWFANTKLVSLPVYNDHQEIEIPSHKRLGIGYYPLEQAQHIKKTRAENYADARADFLAKHDLIDSNQKILVYTGGNNEEYFNEAFPACLDFFTMLSKEQDLSNCIILLQQHPGAKKENNDGNRALQWLNDNRSNSNAPKLFVSDIKTDEALIFADAILYHQTSMGPQFVLAQIPTIQIAHKRYKDILVRNNLCFSVTNQYELKNSLEQLKKAQNQHSEKIVKQGLGIDENWTMRIEQAISKTLADPSSTTFNPGIKLYVSGAIGVCVLAYVVSRFFRSEVKSN